jgi:hypothetical protein
MTNNEPKPEPEESAELDPADEGSDLDVDDEIEGMDLGVDLGAILSTEDGDTVCTALLDINNTIGEVARQISTTNKVLIKILSKMK